MKKLPPLLVAGVGPLPPENPERLFAPGLRIWGMARELARAGHPVRLATIDFGVWDKGQLKIFELNPEPAGSEITAEGGCATSGRPSTEGGIATPMDAGNGDAPLKSDISNLKYQISLPPPRIVNLQDSELSAALRSEAQDFGAAAAIGSTDLMNRALAETELGIPLWCDFFGDPMAERQMLAMIHGSDDGLSGQWEMMVPALRRADRLSGCSRRQVGAIEGEMATLGRLNRHTAHERLVACIPPWIEPIPPSASQTKLLRGVKMPEDAFIVLQTGGFNSWLDARTLFAALESAMAENPKIYFAATGGAIPGHNNKTYDLFASLVSASRNKERYHLLGWIPLGDVPRVIAEADLGLNVDLPCLEGWLGTRNRIMDWIMGGLPVVSTLGTELVEELNRHGLIRTTAQGDAKKLAELILEMAGNRHASRGQAEQARAHLIEAYSAHRCLNPLLDWASAPSHAPDLAAWQNNRATPSQLWRDAENNPSALDEARVRLARADAHLKSLHGSSLVRVALRLRRLLGKP